MTFRTFGIDDSTVTCLPNDILLALMVETKDLLISQLVTTLQEAAMGSAVRRLDHPQLLMQLWGSILAILLLSQT